MDHFTYINGTLHAEQVPVSDIAEVIGTPFYCYSSATLTRHYTVFASLFEGLSPLAMVCFAVKANSNLAVLQLLGSLGAGADVVSEGEIRRALAAGIPPERIVFSGIGKARDEMAYALEQGIYQFNVESAPELELLNEVAGNVQATAPIAIRINPDVDPVTHAKISTGLKESKFGVEIPQAMQLYDRAAELPNIRVQGVSVHIGSQLLQMRPFADAFQRVRDFIVDMRAAGHRIETLDLGGGFGIQYGPESPPSLEEYGRIVREATAGLECRLMFEPGRVIAGNAGILVSRVLYVKKGSSRHFVIVDAAMNDLMRPALYDAYHDVVAIDASVNQTTMTADLVGPVCETGDILGEQQSLPSVNADDLIALRSAGAYGAVMASTYNSRRLIPEVLVKDDCYAVIRPRQSYEELLGLDRLPDWV